MTGEGSVYTSTEEVKRIYEEDGDFIRKVIQARVGNQLDTNDVFQNLFLHLLEKPFPDGVRNRRSYLYRVITNNVINEFHKVTAYKKRIGRYSYVRSSKAKEFDSDPHEKIAQAEEFDCIMSIIDNKLPSQVATALKLRYKDDYTNGAIAQTMSVKKDTGRRYIRRGLRRLQRIFERYPS